MVHRESDNSGNRARRSEMSEGKLKKDDGEWRQQLTPNQYFVTRQKGTEPPFTGEYEDTHTAGTYKCVCCGQPLFRSETKFDSGSGWPSFYAPAEEEAVDQETDRSQPAYATASIRLPSISKRTTRESRPPKKPDDRFQAAGQE